MASRGVFTAGLFVVIFSQAISSTAADNDVIEYSGGSCSGMPQNLAEGCSISSDCSTITCKMNFVEKPITFTLKVNKCEDPVTVTATMDVPDLDITWSHKYTSDDIVEVPGFSVSVPDIFSAGVYVQVGLTDNGDNLHLKVNLLAGGEILGKGIYPVKVTVMEGDLPISTDECGILEWWYDLSDIAKAAVIGGPLLVIIIMIICCCCCCGCCKSRPANQGSVFITPGVGPTAVMATNTNTKVPMRPLVEYA